jgi:hypothetical protein
MADKMTCTAVRNDGSECVYKVKNNGLCGVHANCMQKSGPHGFALKQMDYRQKKDLADLKQQLDDRDETLVKDETYAVEHRKLLVDYQLRLGQMRGLHATDRLRLLTEQRREIEGTGVDPDAAAKQKKAEARAVLMARREERSREFAIRIATTRLDHFLQQAQHYEARAAEETNHLIINMWVDRLNHQMELVNRLWDDNYAEAERRRPAAVPSVRAIVNDIIIALGDRIREIEHAPGLDLFFEDQPPVIGPGPLPGLAAFVQDPQNVHTTVVVTQTMEIIRTVRRIAVPEEYRWNRDTVSPTIGEIIANCKLSSSAAATMFNKYVSAETVYDLEEGIYGKVLDSVWQYVKASPDKADLCAILKQEMTDNVGMCAQGNLTRICNILAGYLDGIGSQESVAERLGRLFPPLMEIEDEAERLRAAEAILTENAVPRDEWSAWVDAVM